MSEQQPYCDGAITVEIRARDDVCVHLTSDPRIWAAGRSVYEAVGYMVVHHPEHFFAALARPQPDGDQSAALRAALETIASESDGYRSAGAADEVSELFAATVADLARAALAAVRGWD